MDLEDGSNLELHLLRSSGVEVFVTVAAVDRCLLLLEALAGEREPVELTDLGERLDMPASAAHRLLATLVDRGWVVRDRASQRYALSLRMSTLAFRNLDVRAVPDAVQSVLDRLAQATREYCRLAIVEGEDLVWVARAQGAVSALRYDPDMGQEVVLHATANAKAWLATLPESEALRIVCARGFEARRPLGPNSVTTVDAFRACLLETRAQGFATSIEEAEAGTAAVAVPFRSGAEPSALVAGTLSVAGPAIRITPDRFAALAGALHVAAAEVAEIWSLRSRQRGYRRPVAPEAPTLGVIA